MPKKLTTYEFIEKSKQIHGEYEKSFLDYSITEYLGSEKPIKFICKKENHGEFIVSHAISHFKNKQSCPICSGRKSTIDLFIEKSKQIHGEYDKSFLDYSITEYLGSNKPIKFICKKENHGEFIVKYASNHISKKFRQGCPICSGSKITNNEFMDKINLNKNENYHHHKIEYISMKDEINVYCSIEDDMGIAHGNWFPTAQNYLNGSGCPKCNIIKLNKNSKAELEIIDFIKSLNINKIILNNRDILNGKELDIYLPDYNLAIEYNGLYWHSDVYKDKNYHNKKTNDCLEKNIQLIHIFEDEWVNKKEIIKSRLLNLLNLTETKIFARKTKIVEVSSMESNKFLIANHLQGKINSLINIGLYHNDELVSLMCFGKLRKNLGNTNKENQYELLRFCNKINTNIIGSASKLLKYFEKIHKPIFLLSYADRRWSIGGLYNKLGFVQTHISPPNYFYVNNNIREGRFKYRKDILITKYDCDINDTEKNFTKIVLKLNRIYDCGSYVFSKNYL